ncbi:alpha/beta hydrolase [Pseudanabaenaceae cyanobacterium LEGE 13415]|nr:alpha/beta hydrolase [Pseudanabaenaceae cyanobacterium LEGE 13415]
MSNALQKLNCRFFQHWQVALGMISAALLSTSTLHPASAAERLLVSNGTTERTISVKSLARYAQTGTVDEELAAYARSLPPEQLKRLQQVLNAQFPFGAVQVSRLVETPTGIGFLKRLQQIIQAGTPEASVKALQTAFVRAAEDSRGLTLLNLLENYPTSEVKINLPRAIEVTQGVEALIKQTNQAVALIQQQSRQPSTRVSGLADLTQTGQFQWNKQTLTIEDRDRSRTFPIDVYLPQSTTSRPVIVISHGLGGDRSTFSYLAEHLASYGFVVAVPEHPGSNAEQMQALLSGTVDQLIPAREFIDRSLDVTVLLNQLERLSNSRLRERLNMQQVGVIGQSFGGFTALTLAGAPIGFEQLRADCSKVENLFNFSLTLQCRALSLPQRQYNLVDPRIKAAIAINPLDSRILGQAGLSQIKIPLMMISGSADTLAPAFPEQIRPFTWLTTPNKYLALMQGGTHFSTLEDSTESSATVGRQYAEALSTAFFQRYLSNQPAEQSYLSDADIRRLSQKSLPLYLVRSLTLDE